MAAVCAVAGLLETLCCHQAPLAPSVLAGLDQRWRNWWIRGVLSVVMISFFVVIVYLGPIALSLLVSPRPLFLVCVCVCVLIHVCSCAQVIGLLLKCFQEIIAIGYPKYQEYSLPLYRVLNWFVLCCFCQTYSSKQWLLCRYFAIVASIFIYCDNFFFYYPEYKETAVSILSLPTHLSLPPSLSASLLPPVPPPLSPSLHLPCLPL